MGDYAIVNDNAFSYAGDGMLSWVTEKFRTINDPVHHIPTNCSVTGGEGTLDDLLYDEVKEE